MASSRPIVEYVVSQLGRDAMAKAMFGEYGVYVRGTLVGSICDDRLFLKRTDAGAAEIGKHTLGSPYPGAKPAIIVPESVWGNAAMMERLGAVTAEALAGVKKPKANAKKLVANKPARKS